MHASDSTMDIQVISPEIAEAPERQEEDFLDCMSDMFGMPDEIELRPLSNGLEGCIRDSRIIRGYFERAVARTFSDFPSLLAGK